MHVLKMSCSFLNKYEEIKFDFSHRQLVGNYIPDKISYDYPLLGAKFKVGT